MTDIEKREMDACKKWIDRDFSSAPTSVLKKLLDQDPESLTLLSSEYPTEGYLPIWGWMFSSEDSTDEAWIKEHIDEIEEIGIYIYEQEDYGILLGLDSCGHCFYESYWLPLYRLRGFNWHLQSTCTEQDACKQWTCKHFDRIPTTLIDLAIITSHDSVRLVTEKATITGYNTPPVYEYMYSIKDPDDIEWIQKNIKTLNTCGFTLYDCDYTGLILGSNAEEEEEVLNQWLELYKKRELNWHQ